eukprot:GILK01005602.1.p1 GENE.GILK01005602.1~~GILK01005602.1.p1  ORF type:complete len:642 (-),score=144.26 GILK01005602.1:110-2035(-)
MSTFAGGFNRPSSSPAAYSLHGLQKEPSFSGHMDDYGLHHDHTDLDGHDPFNKVTNLHHTSVNAKVPPSIATHVVSANAQSRREYLNLQSQHRALEKQFLKANSRIQECLADTKKMRAQLETQEKDLAAYKRAHERLTREKQTVELDMMKLKEYVRKLETKLAMGAKGQALANAQMSLKDTIKNLQSDKGRHLEIMAEMEEKLQKQNQELHILTRALEIRADEFALKGDFRSALLFDVAQNRDDADRLREENGQQAMEINHLRQQVAALESVVGDLNNVREQHVKELSDYERRTSHLESSSQKLKKENSDLRSERVVMLDYIQEMAEKLKKQEDEIEKLRKGHSDSEASVKEEVNHLRQQLQEQQNEVNLLTDKLNQSKKMTHILEDTLSKERKKALDLHSQLDAKLKREEELLNETNNLHSELDHFTELNEQLHSRLAREEEERKRLATSSEQLAAQQAKLHQDLQNASHDKHSVEQALRDKLESTLREMEAMATEKDQLRMAMNDAVARCAATLVDQQGMEKEKVKMDQQIQNLSRSKTLLQRTMAEQIASVRAQLERALEDKNRAESELDRLRDENQRLQLLSEAEHRRGVEFIQKLKGTSLSASQNGPLNAGLDSSPRSSSSFARKAKFVDLVEKEV